MSQSTSRVGTLWAVGCLGVGILIGQQFGEAHADDHVGVMPAHRCAVFAVDVSRRSVVETSDPTTEVGQWIEDQEGWVLASMDFEVGQKPTGYPAGWVQVCLEPQPEGAAVHPPASLDPAPIE